MKIIITGACAVSARSVCRSLQSSSKFKDAELIGWDMAHTLYGLYEGLFKRIYKVPAVSDESYPQVVNEILEKEKPDAVIVVPEVEVRFWAHHPFAVPHITPPALFCDIAISKEKVFEILQPHGLVPCSFLVRRDELLSLDFIPPLQFPMWIRDASAGTASGKGSFMATAIDELQAWVTINKDVECFQLSQYLPGGNYGVFALFHQGNLRKVALAERIEYLMGKVAVSGITGNTCKGRLLNDERIKRTALEAIRLVCEKVNCQMEGLVVCDLKADEAGTPYVTEINIRHVAYSSSLANAGFNISEYQLLYILGRAEEVSEELEMKFPKNNLMLRDVDGLPIFVPNYKPISIGEYMEL